MITIILADYNYNAAKFVISFHDYDYDYSCSITMDYWRTDLI